MRFSLQFYVTDAMFPPVNHGALRSPTVKVWVFYSEAQRSSRCNGWLLVYLVGMEHIARRLLATVAPGRSSQVVLALAAIGAVMLATDGWPAVCAFPYPTGMIG